MVTSPVPEGSIAAAGDIVRTLELSNLHMPLTLAVTTKVWLSAAAARLEAEIMATRATALAMVV